MLSFGCHLEGKLPKPQSHISCVEQSSLFDKLLLSFIIISSIHV